MLRNRFRLRRKSNWEAQADYVAKLRETAKVERMDKPDDSATKGEAKPDAAKPTDAKMAPAKK